MALTSGRIGLLAFGDFNYLLQVSKEGGVFGVGRCFVGKESVSYYVRGVKGFAIKESGIAEWRMESTNIMENFI